MLVWALKKQWVYCLGVKTTVYTDHSALQFILMIQKAREPITQRLGRWYLALQEYDLEIIHRPGSNMAHVDAICRPPGLQVADWEGESEKRVVKDIKDDGPILLKVDPELEKEESEDTNKMVEKAIALESWPNEELAEEQRKDPCLGKLIIYIEGNEPLDLQVSDVALEWEVPMHAINEDGLLVRYQGYGKKPKGKKVSDII